MTWHTEIFGFRMKIDAKRQPRYGTDLHSLAVHLRSCGLDNPYELAGAILNKVPAYGNTCRGPSRRY